jgi:outer membrane protein OmpA-like peptidoglycan-associated protein
MQHTPHQYLSILTSLVAEKLFLVFLGLFLSLASLSYAQVTVHPSVEFQNLSYLNITKVQITETQTIVDLRYRCPYDNVSWACANKEFYIKGVYQTEKKRLLAAKNIPICDDKHWFTRKDTILDFQLIFPKLEAGIEKIDMIEGYGPNQFNFWGVKIINPKKEEKEVGNQLNSPPTITSNTTNTTIDTNKNPVKTTTKKTTTIAKKDTVKNDPAVKTETKPTVTFNNKELKLKDSINVKITFDHASDVIEESSKPELNKLLDFMQKNPKLVILLEGHTEADEPSYTPKQKQSNLKLSIERLKSVKDFLTAKGISPTRIQTQAYGGARPVSKDPAQNRRVVMKIIKF